MEKMGASSSVSKKITVTLSALALVAMLASCQSAPLPAEQPLEVSEPPDATVNAEQFEAPTQEAAPFAEGSDEWIAWTALMGPDGEYAAAASYEAVLEKYGQVEPYASILEGELRHIDALQRQLERMGVAVPENPYTGTISAPDDLVTAAEAWAEGEILNVEMYDELIEQAQDSNLVRVLTNLRRASLESHLPAFEEAAANGGTSP